MIHEPLTKLQCSPTSDGSAGAIVACERFVDEHDLWDRAIEIAGQAMVTDLRLDLRRATPTASRSSATTCRKQAADRAYEEAQVGTDDVDVSSCTTASAPTS